MGDAVAIPREINLALTKPVATPAFTRRFKSQANTPIIAAGTQATIVMDTAQPGSFIDTLSSYLSFTLDITNVSTTSGYNVSFSAAGAQSLIRAMRIYIQGVPVEEITEYNALVEWLHDLTGIPDYSDRSAKSRYLANTMFDTESIYLPPATTTGSTVTPSVRSMNIQLPLVSGVLGSMADKMFPSMLVAPGNCYIQLDLSSAAHAFRVQEIDLSNIVVGTAGVGGDVNSYIAQSPSLIIDNAAIGIGQKPYESAITGGMGDTQVWGASVDPQVNTNARGMSHHDATVGTQGFVSDINAKTILDDGPLDVPFATTGSDSGDANAYRGVLTTEERIGGGMFYSGTTPYTGLSVADKVGTYCSGTPIAALSNSTSSSTGTIFVGGGMNSNAGQSDPNVSRMTKSSVLSNIISYQIRDLEYVGKQVVVGDDVARAIIDRAAVGDISIHTQSYRNYPTTFSLLSNWGYRLDPAYQVSSGNPASITFKDGMPLMNGFQRVCTPGAQSVIIPAKISSANAMYFIFRNGQAMDNFLFDSMRRVTVGFSDGPGSFDVNASGASAQLRIGNTLVPQSPIQSASEALEELLKAHHMDGHYGTTEKMGSVTASSAQYQWPNRMALFGRRNVANTYANGNDGVNSTNGVQPLTRSHDQDLDTAASLVSGAVNYVRNDFNSMILCPDPSSVSWKFRPFSTYSLNRDGTVAGNFFSNLGSQSNGNNQWRGGTGIEAAMFYTSESSARRCYNRTFLQITGPGVDHMNTWQYAYPESQEDYARRQFKWKDAIRRAFFGYADSRCDHQITDPSKPNFMNPFKQHTGRYSTFMLGFDLDAFSNNTDTIRSGQYLGNNTVSLNLTNTQFIDNSPLNMPLMTSVRMDTYVLHDVRLSFQAGGIVQAFY